MRPVLDHQGELTWHSWESRTVMTGKKQVNRKMLVTKAGDIHKLTDDLKQALKFLAEHLFRADWQNCQFSILRQMTPFPERTVCMVLDFAENLTCDYQQEVQAAHWHHDQVTIHPTVSYYRCPACEETVTESLVFISPDRRHDFHAVHHFTAQALAHLREKRGLTVDHVIQYTDGCAAQYKSKGPFADIACSFTDFGVTMERNFFGSRHGKGPSDGETAVVKQAARTAVASEGAVIANAGDLYNFLIGSRYNKQPAVEGCTHFLRSFFFVGDGEISRDRNDRKAMTVPGTRSFHTVKCEEQSKILSRHLACTCGSCLSGVGDCAFSHVVGPWSSHTLRFTDQQNRPPHQPAVRRPPRQPAVRRPRPRNPRLDPSSDEEDQPSSPPSRDVAPPAVRRPRPINLRIRRALLPPSPQPFADDNQPASPEINPIGRLDPASGEDQPSSPPSPDVAPPAVRLPAVRRPRPRNPRIRRALLPPAPQPFADDDQPASPEINPFGRVDPASGEDQPSSPPDVAPPSPKISLLPPLPAPTSDNNENQSHSPPPSPEIVPPGDLLLAPDQSDEENKPPLAPSLPSPEINPFLRPALQSHSQEEECSSPASPRRAVLQPPQLVVNPGPEIDGCSGPEGDHTIKEAQPAVSSAKPRVLRAGDWVKAKFITDKGNIQFYHGVIEAVGDQEMRVKFLRKRGDMYIFPDVEDISWVSVENLVAVAPPVINRRLQHFFD